MFCILIVLQVLVNSIVGVLIIHPPSNYHRDMIHHQKKKYMYIILLIKIHYLFWNIDRITYVIF